MQGKIFGIPLTVIVMVLVIVAPIIAGELVIVRALRELTHEVVASQAEDRMLFTPVTPEATPSATPTEKPKTKVWTPPPPAVSPEK